MLLLRWYVNSLSSALCKELQRAKRYLSLAYTRTLAARRTKDRLAARLVRARTHVTGRASEKGLQAYRTVLDRLSNYRRVG